MCGGNFSNVSYFDNLTIDEFWEHWEIHQECVAKMQESMTPKRRGKS